jgi:hypothetical protein
MRKLLLLLAPVALFAQVLVDTVIHLPTSVGRSIFVPELNELYLTGGDSSLLVLDCSTYQLKTRIPLGLNLGASEFIWNWRRQKLYIVPFPPPESTLVIDAAADSVLGWLKFCHELSTGVYLSDVDRIYKPAWDTLYELDCAADTVLRRLMPGESTTCASWDSTGQKLYVGLGSRKKLAVFDYLADSCLKLIDVSAVSAIWPDALVFNHANHRGLVWSYHEEFWPTNVGIIDTENDTLLKVLPANITMSGCRQLAVDERDGRIYIADNYGGPATPDTMWVVDCATDSVRKFESEHRGNDELCVRWVPWSNRIYLVTEYPDAVHKSAVVVIDCNTDSVIVPGTLLNSGFIPDIQLDPIHRRIFVIGVDTNYVYVLRDTGYAGVAEAKPAGPHPSSGLQVQMMPGGFDVRYSVAAPCRADLAVYDLMGREVRQLVTGQQPAGQHSVVWNGKNRDGRPVARGVYFINLDTPVVRDVQKVVITR